MQGVDVGPIGEFAVETYIVGASPPGFDADEGGFGVRRPEPYDRGIEEHGEVGSMVGGEQGYAAHLRAGEDDGIGGEGSGGQREHAVVVEHDGLFVRANTPAVGDGLP